MHHPSDDGSSNPSANPSFDAIVEAHLSRRAVLAGGLGVAAAAFLGGPGAGSILSSRAASASQFKSWFTPVPVSSGDNVVVPPGYKAEVLFAWGDPVSDGPKFEQNASNSAEDQMVQAGMHHDGMHYFPFPGSDPNAHGLLVMNHEYTDDGLLHVGGMEPWTAAKVLKSKAAHGVSVIEVRKVGSRWEVVRPSRYGRRITADTPCAISGPVAESEYVRTAGDPRGLTVRGTLNNCAHGYTPWGTYLTCEENFNGYFSNETGDIAGPPERKAALLAEQSRYGITKGGFGYRWHEHDLRFRADLHPNEVNRFGWVVEIDPFNPSSTPVKRTALGRFKHEGAWTNVGYDGRVAVYMGDDERNEYVYKFVSRDRYVPGASSNRNLLDNGTLYAARFNADGTGTWLPLVYGQNGLTPANGFSSQAEVLVKTRQAADRVGATMMDRPEWIAVHPVTNEVYMTLTNNNRRGTAPASSMSPEGTTAANSARPPVDAANPRANNVYGHIIRWRESGRNSSSTTFTWDIFILAGDPSNALVKNDPSLRGNIKGDVFGSPDGLWFDQFGMLWIQTDVSTSTLNSGDYAFMGNNQMLAADVTTGEVRRFLTGPRGCEVTGVVMTPDGGSMFVNIQHPGEPASEKNDPASPKAISSWPDGPQGGRPRAATIVIQKLDGGIVGT